MQIKIRQVKDSTLLWEKLIQHADDDYLLPEKIFHTLIMDLFLDKEVALLTIQPQKYSLGYELSDHKDVMVGGKNILLNHINYCDPALLKDIAESEEFKRTLLIIVETDLEIDCLLISELMALIKEPTYQSELLNSATIVYCEDDGESLYLFNSSLILSEVDNLIRGFLSK